MSLFTIGMPRWQRRETQVRKALYEAQQQLGVAEAGSASAAAAGHQVSHLEQCLRAVESKREERMAREEHGQGLAKALMDYDGSKNV